MQSTVVRKPLERKKRVEKSKSDDVLKNMCVDYAKRYVEIDEWLFFCAESNSKVGNLDGLCPIDGGKGAKKENLPLSLSLSKMVLSLLFTL